MAHLTQMLSSYYIQIKLENFRKCWFLSREENQITWRKALRARWEPTTNSTQIWCWVQDSKLPLCHNGHWEASILTSMRSLLPIVLFFMRFSGQGYTTVWWMCLFFLLAGLLNYNNILDWFLGLHDRSEHCEFLFIF